MDAIPLISILVLIFAVVLMSEVIKLKKETRKLSKLVGHLKKDIDILKLLSLIYFHFEIQNPVMIF